MRTPLPAPSPEPARPHHATFAVVALAALAACTPKEAPPPAALVVVPTLDAPATPPPTASNDPCHRRPHCVVEARHDAGTSAAGRAMVVLEVSLGLRDEGADEPSGMRDCEEREAWLVHEGEELRAAAPRPPPRLLVTMCNDGYGASGVGEDELSVQPNQFSHTRMGGSSWRWSTSRTAQLDPPAVLSQVRSVWWAVSQNHDARTQFDFTTFAGYRTLEMPACDAKGEMPDLGTEEEIDAFGSQPIPALALPERLVTGPMAEAADLALGSCALRSVVPTGAEDAGYAAVLDARSGTLLVQLSDDVWTKDDRLIVWASKDSEGPGGHCFVSRKVPALEIDPSGVVVEGAAAYPGVVVTAAASSTLGHRLVRVALGALPEAITIAYRDVDPGKGTQGIATSDAEAHQGELVTLGVPFPIAEQNATCEIEDGRLVPRPAEPPAPSEALLGDGW